MSKFSRESDRKNSDQLSIGNPRKRVARDAEDRLEREKQFKLENADAFASVNAWVEENGLPLAKYRAF